MSTTLAPTGELIDRFMAALPAGIDHASMRVVDDRSETLSVRSGVMDPARTRSDRGAMITVWVDGGVGHGATSDLRVAGLRRAAERATEWALATAAFTLTPVPPSLDAVGTYESLVERPWHTMSLDDRLDMLAAIDGQLAIDHRIVDRGATLAIRSVRSLLVSTAGGRIEQDFTLTYPNITATAAHHSEAQSRSYGRNAFCGQGGVEVLERFGFTDAGPRIATEAIALLEAPNCPTGTMDILADPDQMVLQIHESIGHALELDRILGDERNFAGTSFVTTDMFGKFRYGSDLLNVTFDPTVPGQIASYGFDDEGTPAERTHLIRGGILERPLGGATSQRRADMAGVAATRACSWNRPPIDRMANLNVEPGTSTLDELIAGIESGVWMQTNTSWSIDDSRNKFQFGCELGRVIRDGEVGEIVRNPNYRGISQEFWRNLSGVGDPSTFAVMGTPRCGKGELNQLIGTGHASPACRFSDVDVFGGAQ